jgi:putative endonuclease
MTAAPYFVYILECSDGSLYTGIATDLEKRFKEHGSGKGAKYTRARGAKRICYSERCIDKGSALKREMAIKKLSRAKKLLLIGWMPSPKEAGRSADSHAESMSAL